METEDVEKIAASLSKAQRHWFQRGMIRIGNPVTCVPRLHPMALNRTWDALKKKGLIEHGRFGQQMTDLGLAVRAALQNKADTPTP